MNRSWALAAVLAGFVAACMAAVAQEPLPPPMKYEPSARLGENPGGHAAKGEGEAKGEPAKKEAGAAAKGAVRIVAGQRSAGAESRTTALGFTTAPHVDVSQSRPDQMMVNMTGLVAAGGLPCEDSFAEIVFDLTQNFAVVADRPDPRGYRLIVEGQLGGLFRANRSGPGVAAISIPAEAVISAGGGPVVHVGFPGRSHTGRDVLLVSDRTPPVEAIVGPGEYCLNQKFAIRCSHVKKCFHKNVVTAAFGEPAGRMPEWLTLLDPTRDLPKNRDFGFRVALRVEPLPAGVALTAPVPVDLLPPAK